MEQSKNHNCHFIIPFQNQKYIYILGCFMQFFHTQVYSQHALENHEFPGGSAG